MKHLFFGMLTTFFISATPSTLQAQTSVHLEKISKSKSRTASPRFIESIEINPAEGYVAAPEIKQELTDNSTVKIYAGAAPAIENYTALHFKYALLMNMEVEALANTALYSFIDSWWGTRYRYGGQDKDGIDCSAFCNKIAGEVYGITIDRTAKDQFRQCAKIADSELQEGDLVFFNTRGGVSHVGLYLGNSYFVHSSTSSGVTISSLSEDYYSKRFISGGRLQK
ncbi:MAG TPA: NlpC/P60 family protein [Ferruginibacter sp.]|nr:NlpC/P60 family protein [Ferruginibacter sp.]HMP21221.1 NlpC/P60 family protein [Ferruginibacter sp.]